MEPGCDLVEKLLESTGLSCDDLLKQIQQYRSKKTQVQNESTNSNKQDDTTNKNVIKKLCISSTNNIEDFSKTSSYQSTDDTSSSFSNLEAVESTKDVNDSDHTVPLVQKNYSDTNDIIIIEQDKPEKVKKSINIISSMTFTPEKTFDIKNDNIVQECDSINSEISPSLKEKEEYNCSNSTELDGSMHISHLPQLSSSKVKETEIFTPSTSHHSSNSNQTHSSSSSGHNKISNTLLSHHSLLSSLRKSDKSKHDKFSEDLFLSGSSSYWKKKENNISSKLFQKLSRIKAQKSPTSPEKSLSIFKEQENSTRMLSSQFSSWQIGKNIDSTVSSEKDQRISIQSNRISLSVHKKPSETRESDEIVKSQNEETELFKTEENHGERSYTNIVTEDCISSKDDSADSEFALKDSNSTNSEDNLRNVLRKQLSSLRNMKKSNEILPDLRKKSIFLSNMKKKRKSCDAKSLTDNLVDEDDKTAPEKDDDKTAPEKDDDDKADFLAEVDDKTVMMQEDLTEKETDQIAEMKNEGEKLSSNDNSLVSLTDETEFIILDVTGGVDRLTPLVSESESISEEDRNFASIASSDIQNDDNKVELKTYKNKKIEVNFDGFADEKEEKRTVPTLRVKQNMSANFNQDSGINKSVKNSEKSPFVSDSLDDFLNENAELRISYPIPKLGAEEGIGEKTKNSPFDKSVANNNISKSKQQIVHKEKPRFKAKTLAEMRRQLLKMEAQSAVKDEKLQEKGTPVRPKKKFKEYIAKKKELIVDEGTSDVKSECDKNTDNFLPRNSFVLFNNDKIWVSSKNEKYSGVGLKLSKEKFSTVSSTPKRSRKLSILSCLDQAQNTKCKVTYKPGPLCKKASLQNSDSRKNWVSELKELPKIFLEVVPEYKKAIDPKVLHLLPVFDKVEIDEQRTNFALTALQPKNENCEHQTFTFHIPYKNKQEKMVVRRPCYNKPRKQDIKPDNPQTEIANILDGLITYVETKEIEDSLVKEEDYQIEKNDDNRRTKLRLSSKRKKLNLELRRLNCKVIDVANDDNEVVHCTKSYCRLGCVCKSLLSEIIVPSHCGRVECMFECKCPTIVTKELQSNQLSPITVNHLEDKAKKNLAKVEKEFTQTLIHTGNQAILVATAKMRRALKPPKKYTDYIKDDLILDKSELIDADVESLNCKACEIVLEEMDLSHIVPYCLAHHLYDCHCKGEELPTEKKDVIPKLRIMKVRDNQYVKVETCARIRKVFPEYKERNKDPVYNEKLHLKIRRRAEKRKESLHDEEEKPEVAERALTETLIDPTIEKKDACKPNKRKQSFRIREELPLAPIKKIKPLPRPIKPLIKPEKRDKEKEKEIEKEFALQRRKKKLKANYVPVFDGEIKLSLQENQDLVKIIGSKNASLEYLRILPWNFLVENYTSGRISIWAKDTQPSALLCNRKGYLPPKNFKDIRLVHERNEIIDWILKDHLPPDRPRELMHLILTPRHIHFLIAGYCLKKINPENSSLLNQHSTASRSESNEIETNKKDEAKAVTTETVKKTLPKLILIENVAKPSCPPKFEITNKVIKPTKIIISKKQLKKGSSAFQPELLKLPSGTSLYPITSKSRNSWPTSTKDVSYVVKRQVTKSPESASCVPTIQQILSAQSIKTFKEVNIPEKRTVLSANLYEPPKKKILIETTKENQRRTISEPITIVETELEDDDAKESSSRITDKDLVVLPADDAIKPTPMELNNVPDLEVFEIHPEEAKTDKRGPIKEKSIRIIKQSLIPSRSIKSSHKDMLNKNQVLVLTSKVFMNRNLYFQNGTKREELKIPLPTLSKNAKWRMIYLNSDFSYLNFVKSNYSIKYTDLMDVVKISNMTRFTVILRNKQFCSEFKHPQFGIFCVPKFQDRLFIGPYLSTEDHGIETLRYMQGDLIKTQIFISMVGRQTSDKQPTWVFETNTDHSPPSETIIDITDDEEIIVNNNEQSTNNTKNSILNILDSTLMCFPFVDVLDLGDKMPKNAVNRCVMTNIPHMGYFEAHQFPKMFEIYWPTGNKCFRFANVNVAKPIIQQFLSQIFCPIPKFLKINIIIMTTAAVQNCKPIDPKFFTEPGPYFCGDFGVCKQEEVPEKVLKLCNITSLDDHLKEHLESEENDNAMLRIFSTFLMSPEELKKHNLPSQILQWATSEIYILKKLEENYLSEKKDLQSMIDKHSLEFKRKLKLFKEKVIKKAPETIEIADSDEEKSESEGFKKIAVSGKILSNSSPSKGKSLLRPNLLISGGNSVLKPSESSESSTVVQPVKISMHNSKFLLERNAVLLTKIT